MYALIQEAYEEAAICAGPLSSDTDTWSGAGIGR